MWLQRVQLNFFVNTIRKIENPLTRRFVSYTNCKYYNEYYTFDIWYIFLVLHNNFKQQTYYFLEYNSSDFRIIIKMLPGNLSFWICILSYGINMNMNYIIHYYGILSVMKSLLHINLHNLADKKELCCSFWFNWYSAAFLLWILSWLSLIS